MTVYFVHRCHYEGPSEKRLVRFKDDTVLDWFRNRWHRLAVPDDDLVCERLARLGCDVYGFASLFRAAAEQGLPAPQTDAQLETYLHEHLYAEGEILCTPHALQVLTDDDELELAYYFFDDHYLRRNRWRAAFLLHEGWKLPPGEGRGGFRPAEPVDEKKPQGRGAGATYEVLLSYFDSANLSDLSPSSRVKGVRLPDFARYLATAPSADGECWSQSMALTRAALTAEDDVRGVEKAFLRDIRQQPRDDVPRNAYADWLQECGEPPAGLHLLRRGLTRAGRYTRQFLDDALKYGEVETGNLAAAWHALTQAEKEKPPTVARRGRSKSKVHVDEHVAQLCLHVDRWGDDDLYHQWIYFDDVWASAHPDLANGLLRFARRWDVLTTD